MSAYDVNVDELASVIAAMDACGRDLVDLVADVETSHRLLHADWEGLARDAHVASHASWRTSFDDMAAALAGLRDVGETARANYTAAVEANVAMWGQVR